MLTENSFASLVNKTREYVCELRDLSLGNYYTQVCLGNVYDLFYLDYSCWGRYNDFCLIGPRLMG